MPSTATWKESLNPLLEVPLDPSLAITNVLGGAVFLTQHSTPPGTTSQPPSPDRDGDGFSVAFRKALFVAKIFSQDAKLLADTPLHLATDYLYFLVIVLEMARDELDLRNYNSLWQPTNTHVIFEIEKEVQTFIDSSQQCLAHILSSTESMPAPPDEKANTPYTSLVWKLLSASQNSMNESYYAARALYNILSANINKEAWAVMSPEEWFPHNRALNSRDRYLTTHFDRFALWGSLGRFFATSAQADRICRELVDACSSFSPNAEGGLNKLVLLNICLKSYKGRSHPIGRRNGNMAILGLTNRLHEMSTAELTEAAKALRSFYLLLREEGFDFPHENIFSFCVEYWNQTSAITSRLPAIHATLRLVSTLKEFASSDHDELEMVDSSIHHPITRGLFNLLQQRYGKETQPLRVVHELLHREVETVSTDGIQTDDLYDFFPLVASDYRHIQLAAFGILHQALPEIQKQISIDVLLEKQGEHVKSFFSDGFYLQTTDAKLPEELLSLLLDAPSLHHWSDSQLAQFPLLIHSYLLSWRLVFDSYTNASYKVRSDYSEILKSEGYIGPLLQLIFDVLGLSAGVPLKLEHEGLTSDKILAYISDSTDPEQDMHWFLVHIYYLCLKYLPTLVKNWWIECKSKQTRISVESWTEKYFSDIIVSETLQEVATWAAEQEAPTDDDKELIVKISPKSKEVLAGFEIDETQMQIVIRLPSAYPLYGVKVEGVSRVAVNEKKWQSWVMITQGVITLSVSFSPCLRWIHANNL
jgi:hypothetical protein